MKIKANQKTLIYTAIPILLVVVLLLAYNKFGNVKIDPRTAVENSLKDEKLSSEYSVKEYYDTVYLDAHNAVCIYLTSEDKICTAYCVNRDRNKTQYVCSNVFTITPEKLGTSPDGRVRDMEEDVMAVNKIAFAAWIYDKDVSITVNDESPVIKNFKVTADGKEYNIGMWFRLLLKSDKDINVKVN